MTMNLNEAETRLLKTVLDHDEEWGWYPFETAFPPGSFKDVASNITVRDILGSLMEKGLVVLKKKEPQDVYAVTELGRDVMSSDN